MLRTGEPPSRGQGSRPHRLSPATGLARTKGKRETGSRQAETHPLKGAGAEIWLHPVNGISNPCRKALHASSPFKLAIRTLPKHQVRVNSVRMPIRHGGNMTAPPPGGQRRHDDRNQGSGTPAQIPAGQLVVVATPIGNLGDMTARALDTLRAAAVIACEDTRTTGKLLHRFGIDTKMTPYHEHNAERARPGLLAAIRSGKTVALVSDAGTPLVSDPGYRLVEACVAEDLRVTVAPGPSAPVAALVLSGLPSASFYFGGFLPTKSVARRKTLGGVRDIPTTLIFFESANRLAASLADAAAVLGDRGVAVAREITKLHEEVRRGTLSEIAAHYAASGAPKSSW